MTTLAAPTRSLHDALIAALDGNDPEGALEQGLIQLRRGADLSLLLAIVKALVRIGVGGVALRLLHSSNGVLSAAPQLAALAAQLERVPSGAMSLNQLRQAFRQNVAAIEDSSLTDGLNESSLRMFSVFASRSENMYLFRDDAAAKFSLVFHPNNQPEQARKLPLAEPSLATAYALVGVPTPALTKRLVSIKLPNGFQPPIEIIETDPEIASVWLGLTDVSTPLKSGRLKLFVGKNAVEQYKRYLVSHDTRGTTCETLTCSRPGWSPPVLDRRFFTSIAEEAAIRRQQSKVQLDRDYESRTNSFWKNRFTTAGISQQPLSIVGFTSRYSTVMQHAMRDLSSAFRKLGCTFHVAMQANSHSAAVNVIGTLKAQQPDLVVVINHLRNELLDSIPANLPYVCWIQDYMQPLWDRKAGESVGPYDLVLSQSPDVMASVYGYPAERSLATSNLTSSDMFSAAPLPQADRARYECDVSYVAHGAETPEILITQISGNDASFERLLRLALDRIRVLLRDRDGVTTQDLVDLTLHAEKESGMALTPAVRRSAVVPSIQRLVDRVFRHQAIGWVVDWARSRRRTLKLFGQGWEKHPQFSPFACGTIDHGYALRCLAQGSRINLQINAYGSLHQRLLDAIASGGFVLSRYVPADFIKPPFEHVRHFIHRHAIRNLPHLLKAASGDQHVRQSLKEIERLTGTRIANEIDPENQRQLQAHAQCASLDPELFTNEGLFRILRDGIGVPKRAASDLPNFEQTTFRNQTQLHELLDRFVDASAAREQIAGPMRESVLANDTYDQLACRILNAFRTQFEELACDC